MRQIAPLFGTGSSTPSDHCWPWRRSDDDPQPGNRNDTLVYRTGAINQKLAGRK